MHESRDPDAFYDSVIMPYKGLLEEWYVANASPALYLKLVLLTGWIVAGGSRSLIARWLPGLPEPPAQLVEAGAAA